MGLIFVYGLLGSISFLGSDFKGCRVQINCSVFFFLVLGVREFVWIGVLLSWKDPIVHGPSLSPKVMLRCEMLGGRERSRT